MFGAKLTKNPLTMSGFLVLGYADSYEQPVVLPQLLQT
jgi:hypothetical protein